MFWNSAPNFFIQSLLLLQVLAHLKASQNAPVYKHCKLPASGTVFETATPEEVGLNSTWVNKAAAYANLHNRISLLIFRYNCLVAVGDTTALTADLPNNVWSCTKSVVSILTGIAHDMGKLKLTDEVGKYLPTGPGWGNAAHRKITILDLLTETAGLQQSIISEAATVGADSSAPQEALAQKLIHEPGSYFQYTQRVPDLLNYVVQRAVGEDIQTFAQKYLFGPIGIPEDSYFWLRDRSGDTYGYAWLFIPPTQLAKLGLLMQHAGNWNGKQIVSAQYVANASSPTETNPCYGWLFWNNKGTTCTGADIFAAQKYDRRATPAAPTDMFAMVGALQQNNFMLPSLDMTITWSGFLGDTEPNLSALISSAPANLYDDFFSLLMRAVENHKVPHKGFLKTDPLDLDVNPMDYVAPQVLLKDIDSNPDCNILICRGGIPLAGTLEDVQEIARVL